MKTKISFIIALLAFTFSLSAQKGAVSTAEYELTLEEPDLDKATEKILAAEKHEKTINYVRTYIVKERVFRAKYTKDNTDTESLFTAFDAIKKAEELDIKGNEKGKGKLKYRDEIKTDLTLLHVDVQNCGAAAYNAKDYSMALKCFESVLEINDMPSFQEEGQAARIDTAVVFNTAICAYYSDDTVKTTKYMLQCIEYEYGGSTPLTVMYMYYREAKDTVNMVNTLKEGFEKFPEDLVFLKELVIYYINSNNLDEGMKYINLALDKDPNNSAFWFTKGTFHDQAGDKEKALDAYNKALNTATTEDETYNANYNLAVMYYNDAVEAANAANEELDMKKSKKMTDNAKEKFKECLPYFEKCLEIKGDDIETLKALRPVYYRLSDDPAMMKKYDDLQKKIKAYQGE